MAPATRGGNRTDTDVVLDPLCVLRSRATVEAVSTRYYSKARAESDAPVLSVVIAGRLLRPLLNSGNPIPTRAPNSPAITH
ncbi:MAG: hypothetical protein K0V04_04510 [Deltaproteobacteria bacterium]|nr:hypothetical protein [Deltaproteobacteria bacterium]